MGTRHLVAVVSGGKRRIAQYGQFDGYFTGVGDDVFNFVKNKMNFDVFKERVEALQFYTKKELDDLDKQYENTNKDTAKLFEEHPELTRSTSAEILELVQDGSVTKVVDSWSFGADSLFCEYAYVVNLDSKVVECYTGFNRKKAVGRFARYNRVTAEFKPVKLFKKIPFDKIHDKLGEELKKQYDEQRAEEEK